MLSTSEHTVAVRACRATAGRDRPVSTVSSAPTNGSTLSGTSTSEPIRTRGALTFTKDCQPQNPDTKMESSLPDFPVAIDANGAGNTENGVPRVDRQKALDCRKFQLNLE